MIQERKLPALLPWVYFSADLGPALSQLSFYFCFLNIYILTFKIYSCYCVNRSDSFENPVLQQHFRNMEALALDLMEPEQAVDLTRKEAITELTSSFHGRLSC